MDDADVPQEGNATHPGLRKALYAKGPDGNVRLVTSAGWEVEEVVTRQVLDLLATQAEDARARALRGTASPLEFHMYRAKMDLPLLAQSTGLWQWRVKRHFRPAVFNGLSPALLLRYADALGVTVEAVRGVEP